MWPTWRNKHLDNAKNEKSNPAYTELASISSQTQASTETSINTESTASSSSVPSINRHIWIRGTLEGMLSCQPAINRYPTHCCCANSHNDRHGYCLACMSPHCHIFDFAARCEDTSMSNRNPQALCGHCAAPVTVVGGPGADAQHESYPVRSEPAEAEAEEQEPVRPPQTWCQCFRASIQFWFVKGTRETWGDFAWTRFWAFILLLSVTAPIWVTVLILLLQKEKKDGDWCGCILGASAQNYDPNTESMAKDCYPMMNGSIVLDSNCYWSNGVTFCLAAQAWPYPLTRECATL